MVGNPSWRSEGGRESLLKDREWLGVPRKGPGVVESPFRRTGIVRKALPDVREWSRRVFTVSEVVLRPTLRSGSGREFLP